MYYPKSIVSDLLQFQFQICSKVLLVCVCLNKFDMSLIAQARLNLHRGVINCYIYLEQLMIFEWIFNLSP